MRVIFTTTQLIRVTTTKRPIRVVCPQLISTGNPNYHQSIYEDKALRVQWRDED